jgi:membrane-bound serine protease (ClpP class)
MTEFLFDPNVAYLLLVTTSLLMLAAVLSPGTGFLELSALSLLVLTGWVISNTSVNPVALVVLLAGFVPFWLAIRRSGNRVHLIVAIAMFVLGSTFLYTQPDSWLPAVNPVLGVGTSALVSLFIWWAARRTIEVMHKAPTHDLNTLIGAEGETRTVVYQEGSVYIQGELWSAFSRKEIPANTRVRVLGRSGLVLEVEPVN